MKKKNVICNFVELTSGISDTIYIYIYIYIYIKIKKKQY